MTAICGNPSAEFGARKLVLLTSLVLGFFGTAAAKDHKQMKTPDKPRVVVHIQFEGMAEVDMTIQMRPGDKYYLYVQHAKSEGISILDVSKPEKPMAVAVLPGTDTSDAAGMTITRKLAIVSGRVAAPSRSSESSNTDLALWDTSDPTSPQLVQKFSKVMKWLQDNREFIYVLAADGLWIVSQPENQPLISPDSSAYGD
jgi:hypothetical protein